MWASGAEARTETAHAWPRCHHQPRASKADPSGIVPLDHQLGSSAPRLPGGGRGEAVTPLAAGPTPL
jgi:hypothetical protein